MTSPPWASAAWRANERLASADDLGAEPLNSQNARTLPMVSLRSLKGLGLVDQLLHEGGDVGDDLTGLARRRQLDRDLADRRRAGDAVVGQLLDLHRLLLGGHDALQ